VADAAPVTATTEHAVRVAVAAGYRLVHLYGLSDFTDGFIAARIGEAPRDCVLGGYGLLPELARASGLHRRSLEDTPRAEKSGGVDLDALRFTQMALSARRDIHACIHAHPQATIALSALDVELLPMSQWGIMYRGRVAYLDFTTTDVTESASCESMTAMLAAGAQAIVLCNHGVLTVGTTVAQAFFALHRLELACALQLRAVSAGEPFRMPSATLADSLSRSYWTMTRVDNDGSREWPALLAKLDGLDPAYRD
jgi:ribulose-5-phosphate 4-epimerase/fuculose-1-phosphate aldolase